MKKCVTVLLTFMIAFCFFSIVYAADEIAIKVNDKKVEFVKQKPYIDKRDNRVVVPIEEIADAIGTEVAWNEEKNIITFSKRYDIKNGAFYDDFFGKGKEWLTLYQASFQCGKKGYWVYLETCDDNGVITGKGEWYGRMDSIPVLKDDKVFVPVRYVAEEFGYSVVWNTESNTIQLNNENDISIRHRLNEIQNNPFLEEIKNNIEVYCSCVLELFCADVNWKSYSAVYESEQTYDNGNGLPAVLYYCDSEAPKGNYFNDPTESDYYKVNNFKTNDEVRQYLKKYLSDSVIENWFHNDFLEYQGDLYIHRGARGYGAFTCEPHSIKFVGEREGKYYVTIDFLLFDEPEYTATLEFTNINGNWILTKEYK